MCLYHNIVPVEHCLCHIVPVKCCLCHIVPVDCCLCHIPYKVGMDRIADLLSYYPCLLCKIHSENFTYARAILVVEDFVYILGQE